MEILARNQFPDEWRLIVISWAITEPKIQSVSLFGSRAKGKARDDSDIDLAFDVFETPNETAVGVAIAFRGRWKKYLEQKLNWSVDLFHHAPGTVTASAVAEHAELLFARQVMPRDQGV